MKKIININLSGLIIPIEDSAYEKLKNYIESLRRYFAREEDRDEIINDIESRIAELMNEKIRKGAAAITDADIDEIAASMGRPEDFEAAEAEPAPSFAQGSRQQEYTSANEKKPKGRLYRDTNDKFIGGVCSGIAAYLNVDPAIVRILFAIITFGGFGLGVLAYIVMWIILPARDVENPVKKRLYRNPDDRIFGGVAGGLAAYFHRETWVIRLIFAAPILFSTLIGFFRSFSWHHGFDIFPNIVFGSLTSTFIIAYIILWIVLPEARSNHEKMEMRGEKVDVNTIRQDVKERVKEWGEEVKESAQNLGNRAKEFANTRGKAFASEVGETTRRTGSGCGHAIAVIFKVFFLFIAGSIAFGLFVGLMALLFGLIFGGIAWGPINNFLWTSQWQQLSAWGTLVFFLIVPLVGFITWLIRRIINVRSRSNYLGWTFGFLWTIGWVSVVLFAVSATRDLSSYESDGGTSINVSQPANGKMTVVVSEPALQYTGRFNWIDDDNDGWDLSDDTLKLSFVGFDIRKSNDDQYHVIVWKYSYGRTVPEAANRAESIRYAVYSKDSVLDLASGYAIGSDSKFRGQEVEVEIQVPAGKKIRFDETITEKLNSGSFRKKRTHRHRSSKNGHTIMDYTYEDHFFRYRTNVDYEMGIDGNLKDPEGHKVISDDNGYRYRGTNNRVNTPDTNKVDTPKGKELQKPVNKDTQQQKTNTNRARREEEAVAGSPSGPNLLVI